MQDQAVQVWSIQMQAFSKAGDFQTDRRIRAGHWQHLTSWSIAQAVPPGLPKMTFWRLLKQQSGWRSQGINGLTWHFSASYLPVVSQFSKLAQLRRPHRLEA